MHLRFLAAAGVAALCLAPAAAAASTSDPYPYAPLDRPGPALSVPAALLAKSLHCSIGSSDRREPVLLVPGTTLDPDVNFDWNYERAFDAAHRPWCAVTLPEHATADIQTAGEYVVSAIRTMHRTSGRKIEVVGYSQGGMVPRWALRFWPDTRRMVDDVIGIDPSNNGTLDAAAACENSCDEANWQQSNLARFQRALNSGAETFRGVDYTVVYSHTDEIVVPNLDASGSSSLHTGNGTIANIAVQDICPADASDHLAMGTYDPVAYAVVIDALDHKGPARASRVPSSVCTRAFQPGVDPSSFPADYTRYLGAIGSNSARARQVPAEPPLRPYVFARTR